MKSFYAMLLNKIVQKKIYPVYSAQEPILKPISPVKIKDCNYVHISNPNDIVTVESIGEHTVTFTDKNSIRRVLRTSIFATRYEEMK